MLRKTFCHVKGISVETEKLLWENGIYDWDHFFANTAQISCLTKSKIKKIEEELPLSQAALQQGNIGYFKDILPPKEHWRLCPLGKIAFVDIETTGLSRCDDYITLLGVYDGVTAHTYVRGKNLDEAPKKLKEFDIFVTFNGKQFDLPFIESEFNCRYDVVHLDLRYMLKELGFQGGLKSIERQLGIVRDDDVNQIDGFEAVNLWNRYRRGDNGALQKLLKYNKDDIVNLKALLEYYLDKKNFCNHFSKYNTK